MITGLILAGGRSQRMGGGDKGLIELSGRPMLAHIINLFAPQVGTLAINANGEPARFRAFAHPVVPDSLPGFAGPLAGVLAGLRWSATAAPGATHMATVSADVPFLPTDLVARLTAALGHRTAYSQSIAHASSGGTVHPVIGLWPVALADDLETSLASGLRKVQDWTDKHGALAVEFPFVEVGGRMLDPFFNVNTPEDLDEARLLIEIAHDEP